MKGTSDTKKNRLPNETLKGLQAPEAEEFEIELVEDEEGKSVPRIVPVIKDQEQEVESYRDETRFIPLPPRSIEATGLTVSYLEDLTLKHLRQSGSIQGNALFRRIRLPAAITEQILERLRQNKLVEITGSLGAGLGRTQAIFKLTEAGGRAAERAADRDGYVGAAPVPYKHYAQAVAAQSVRGNAFRKGDIRRHFEDLVLPDSIFDSLGPALNSGRSLFLYGPPGNGKTAICQRLTNCLGGAVFVPHAILVDDFAIRVFDDSIHREVEFSGDRPVLDDRWACCRRPMVMVGGELSLENLDLIYWSELRFYEAPFQLKANCGLLLIDDFGRQKVSVEALLNRWIVPLESDYDLLTLHTGKKIRVPFDVFVVFSTNLDPGDLVDAAFLRRVRYKLEVKRSTPQSFKTIFKDECRKHGIPFDEALFQHLIKEHYTKAKREFNACEPRDLLGQIEDLCAYHGINPALTKDAIHHVVNNYFVEL